MTQPLGSAARDSTPPARDHAGPGLRVCEQLLAEHLGAVARRFGAVGLGVIDLPALGAEPIVGAQVRLAAALYWCRELERGGLLAFVEALALAVERGEDGLAIGRASERLAPFWSRNTQRFAAPEREALYVRVFDREFDDGFARLCAGLDAIARASVHDSVVPLQIRVATIAVELGRMLSDRGVGIVGFAARDIVEHIRLALLALREPELATALGGGSIERILAQHGPRLLGRALSYAAHTLRAQHGVALLRWIADAAGDLQAAARSLGPGHPIIDAGQQLTINPGTESAA